MKRLIKIRGEANLKLEPDLIELELQLRSEAPAYDETMQLAVETLESCKAAIVEEGFSGEDLKTSHFNIQAKYEGYQDDRNEYRQRFVGYTCEQGLVLRFGLDHDRLHRVLAALSTSTANPNVNIRFTVQDTKEATDELLRLATMNAREKAEILAAAACVEVGPLVRIDYDPDRLRPYSSTNYNMDRQAVMMRAESVPEMHAEEIGLSTHVSVVWRIAK